MTDTAKIYIDIDSLLDSRQGILNRLSKDVLDVIEYISTDTYSFREVDDFSDIVDMKEYSRLSKRRPKEILSMSTITYLINILKNKIDNIEKRNTFYNETKHPEVVLNIYPYDLTSKERDHIRDMLFLKLDTDVFITIVSLHHSEISPYYIQSNNFVSCFIYDISKWMNSHLESLQKVKLTDTVLYFPAVYSKKGTKEELKVISDLGFKDIFSYFEFLLSNVVTVSFLPVVFYTNVLIATSILEKFEIEEFEEVDVELPEMETE
jgi:hypothetical protein